MQRKENPVEGRYRWLSTGILFSEMILAYKYREGTGNLQDVPTPIYIWLPWTATMAAGVAYWFYLRFKKGHTIKYPGFESEMHSKQD